MFCHEECKTLVPLTNHRQVHRQETYCIGKPDEVEVNSNVVGPLGKRVPRVLGAGAVTGAGAAVPGAVVIVTGAVVLGAKVAVLEATAASEGLELGEAEKQMRSSNK